MKRINLNLDRLAVFVAGILLPIIVFIASPLSFLSFNQNEYPPSDFLLRTLAILFILSSIGIWVLSKYELKRKFWRFFTRLYYILSLLVFIFYYIPKPFYGDFSQYRLFIIIDLFIVVVVTVFCLLSSPKLIKKAFIVAFFMLPVDITYNMINYQKNFKEKYPGVTNERATEKLMNLPGNVYLIILDGFPGDAFPTVIQKMPDIDLDGYTYFSDFNSVGWSTQQSLPVFFSGKSYDGKRTFDEWEEAAFSSESFRHQTSQIGIQFHDSISEFNKDRKKDIVDFSNVVISDVSFLKLLPYSLFVFLSENYADNKLNINEWSYGFSIHSKLFNNPMQSRSLKSFHVEAIENMIENESNRPARGQIVYLHSTLTHGPYGPDEQCQLQADKYSLKAAFQSYACAFRLLEQFNQHLKELNRFDDSLILVVSDHGDFHQMPNTFLQAVTKSMIRTPTEPPQEDMPPEEKFFLERMLHRGKTMIDHEKLDMKKLSSQKVEVGVAALLLAKSPHSKGFNTIKSPRNLRQIAPTILAHFGLENTLNEYNSIFEKQGFPVENNIAQLTVHSMIFKYRYEDIFQYSKNNKEGKWQFIGRLKPLEPTTHPIAFSTNYPQASSPNFTVEQAFDQKGAFWEASGFSFPIWAQLQYKTPFRVSGYYIVAGPYDKDSLERMPRKWELLGSNDGQQWITLDQQEVFKNFKNKELRYFNLEQAVEYPYYRLNILEGFSPGILRLNEFQLEISD